MLKFVTPDVVFELIKKDLDKTINFLEKNNKPLSKAVYEKIIQQTLANKKTILPALKDYISEYSEFMNPDVENCRENELAVNLITSRSKLLCIELFLAHISVEQILEKDKKVACSPT